MQNTIPKSKLWIKTSLTILPGLWIVIWQGWILDQVSIEFGSVMLGLIIMGTIGANFVLGWRWDAGALTALGALFWLGWEWLKIWWRCCLKSGLWIPLLDQFYNQFGGLFKANPSWLIWVVGIIFLVFVPCFAYTKSGLRMRRSGWGVLGVLILVTVIYISLYSLPLLRYPWFLFYDVFRVSLLLTFVFLGFNFAKREGLIAGLFIVVCEPVWIDMFLNPLYAVRVYVYESPNVGLHLALFVLTCLPWFGFLIIAPVRVAHSRTQYEQRRWLLLFPLLLLIGMEIIRGIALQGTIAEYSTFMWLRRGLKAFQLWLPLWLATVLYAKANLPNVAVANNKKHRDG